MVANSPLITKEVKKEMAMPMVTALRIAQSEEGLPVIGNIDTGCKDLAFEITRKEEEEVGEEAMQVEEEESWWPRTCLSLW